MKDIVIATDNTLGIPAGEIDDGLALLYLLGCQDRVCVRAICTTHGNASTELTNRATHVLAHALHPLLDDVPILRPALPLASSPSSRASAHAYCRSVPPPTWQPPRPCVPAPWLATQASRSWAAPPRPSSWAGAS